MPEYDKTFIIGKGQEDYKVWTKATNFICELMTLKRKSPFKCRILRKPVKVTINIEC